MHLSSVGIGASGNVMLVAIITVLVFIRSNVVRVVCSTRNTPLVRVTQTRETIVYYI